MKFAHMADVHLGYEQFGRPKRMDEFAETFRRAVEKSVEEKVEFVIIAGDLFNTSRPSPGTIKQAIRILQILKDNDIPVFAIEGNHDRTQRGPSILNLLEDLGLLNVLGLRKEKFENEYITSRNVGDQWLSYGECCGIEIFGMKYMTGAWFEANLEKFKRIFSGTGNSILVLHQGIREIEDSVMYSSAASELSLSDLPRGHAYYALGHIHKRYETTYEKSPVVYPGSLERWDFGDFEVRYIWDGVKFKRIEGWDKGFYIVENFKPKFIPLKVRPFIDIHIKGSESEIKKAIRGYTPPIPKEAYVRIVIKWRRPFDVDWIKDFIKSELVRIHTETEASEDKVVARTKLENYFTEVEKEIIELLSENDIENLELVISLLSGEYKKETQKEAGFSVVKTTENGEKNKAKKKLKQLPKKRGDLLAWIRGE
ncbi:DNA double-strand break repair protein Mre11 [Pyrococcus sp. ST04]|uniref:DNA double-strand break repair protein Mre11 n=1 Tax=Pyrococcus sp. ST04 TaxID=1183377 RepID=UPI0002605FD9|nr:DNA double-strand break repair protein Mre11 [Pyrococcus sp. ST04]AFK22720.1 putative DNA repair exonuclease [Pyrococcus sp. ST04]